MTPKEEAAARVAWAERKKAKSRGRIAKMLAIKQEREQFNAIPASRRVWCMKTCRWIDRDQVTRNSP